MVGISSCVTQDDLQFFLLVLITSEGLQRNSLFFWVIVVKLGPEYTSSVGDCPRVTTLLIKNLMRHRHEQTK